MYAKSNNFLLIVMFYRANCSNRHGALIANALLEDLGLITPDNRQLVVNARKVDLARRKNRQNCVENHKVSNWEGLYFDGKRSPTKTVIEASDGSRKQITLKKEHLVLVQEPENKYVGHVTPKTGNAEDTTESIVSKLNNLNVNLGDLKILGGDGCNLNVGWKGGVMRLIEEILKRPLLRAICLLHFGEILFKKVMQYYYGKHKGPTDFPGIGPKLEGCHKFAIVKFKKICPQNFPKMNLDDLSRDQKYLFALGIAIKNGKVDTRLANYTPGPLNHARWLTLAARCLRLYVSEKKPSKKLVAIVTFIMHVYIPHWQAVKTQSSISMGSLHFLNLIKSTRQAQNLLNVKFLTNTHFFTDT
jgi:hypothetical protein